MNLALLRRGMERPARKDPFMQYLTNFTTSNVSTTTTFPVITGTPTAYTITADPYGYTTIDATFQYATFSYTPPVDTRVGKSFADGSEWSR